MKKPENQKYKEVTDVDNAAHQIGQDNTYAQRKQQNVETANGEGTMKRCADR